MDLIDQTLKLIERISTLCGRHRAVDSRDQLLDAVPPLFQRLQIPGWSCLILPHEGGT